MAQGEIVYAAALLHDAFYGLFRCALSLERPDEFGAEIRFHDQALAIWHTIQSDSAQRMMAIYAISTVPTNLRLSPAISRLKWAANTTDKLARYRNLIAHSPVMFRGEMKGKSIQMVPHFAGDGTRPEHRERLALIHGLKFWRALRDDLLDLRDYVFATTQQVRRMDAKSRGAELIGVPQSWPHKPRLRLPLRHREIEKNLAAAVPRPKRRIRRRSSRL